ncbi:MAG: hypothetical protein R2737_06860 [Candidatus Nanopelagicales bacterium]
MSRTVVRRTAAVALALALVPSLSGCFNGFEATTTVQNTMNTGNGVQAQVGDIKIENATLVLGPEGSTSATLVMRLVNAGDTEDELVEVDIADNQAYITGGTVKVAPGASVGFGSEGGQAWVNAYDTELAVSTYVPVSIVMANAGIADISVLVVPATGYYEGIRPVPAEPVA